MEAVLDSLKEYLKDDKFRKLYEFEKQKLGIVKKIIEYRIKNNLSQGQLAKKAAISQQHISKIENADFKSLETLEKILNLIGYKIKLEAVPLETKKLTAGKSLSIKYFIPIKKDAVRFHQTKLT
ncbi:MAG: hypothetical protein A2231_06690 [Candidatus Firestonebacteria bacterium RIFOXYA2_FULL_40_8]|nr:MAG: hypothetical protein A2231_06690 [Candidatus Firestonebacteria bacterium RIFOXYA2_FULL_40_8]